MKTKKSKNIFGMSPIQLIIIVVMACFAGIIIMGAAGFIFYDSFLVNQPIPIQVTMPVLPTMTRTQPAKISLQTATSQPTLTRVPTATKLPTETIMPTPTLWFQANARDLIPTEQEMPSDYKVDTGASGSISDNSAVESYMMSYVNNYPNDPRNKSGDPYLVVYRVTIFNTVDSASSSFDAMDENWISENFGKMFNISSNPQAITPSRVALDIQGVERAAAYISDFNGVSVPGFFVYIKLQNNNGVFVVRTVSHAPFTNEQRILDSAKYFASLLVPKIVR